MQFGIIGKPLSHSFSKSYFENKFRELGLNGYSYDLFEISSIEVIKTMLSEHKYLKGFNVTIPYKESIISFLDELAGDAKEISAVNCVKIIDGKLIGYNTDYYGFSQSIKPF